MHFIWDISTVVIIRWKGKGSSLLGHHEPSAGMWLIHEYHCGMGHEKAHMLRTNGIKASPTSLKSQPAITNLRCPIDQLSNQGKLIFIASCTNEKFMPWLKLENSCAIEHLRHQGSLCCPVRRRGKSRLQIIFLKQIPRLQCRGVNGCLGKQA
jgi:hypothetical protein